MRLFGRASFNARLANIRNTTLDEALGEIELADFQWFRYENDWRRPPNGTARIRVRLRTVDGDHRLYLLPDDTIEGSAEPAYFCYARQCLPHGKPDKRPFGRTPRRRHFFLAGNGCSAGRVENGG